MVSFFIAIFVIQNKNNIMITLIKPNEWKHIPHRSTYNRNVYYNEKTNQYIVENYDECADCYSYYWCNKYGTSIGYAGISTTDEYESIFDKVDIIELDDTIC